MRREGLNFFLPNFSSPFCPRRRLVRRRRKNGRAARGKFKNRRNDNAKAFQEPQISRARVLQKIERKKIQKILQSANNFPLCAVVLV